MLPTYSVPSSIQTPASFVNTSLPGNIALRVAPSSVPPSVSSPQLNNNASPNVQARAAANPAAGLLVPIGSDTAFVAPSFGGGLPGQAAFFAQLIGQGGAQNASALLEVYEQMVQVAQVRYMPSRASEPPPEPTGIYGRILQQEKTPVRDAVAVVPQPVAMPAPAQAAPVMVARPVREAQTQADAPPAPEEEAQPIASSRFSPAAKASLAYVASIARNLAPDYSKTIESA